LKGRIIFSILALLSAFSLHGQTEINEGQPLFPPVYSWHEIGVDPDQVALMRSLDQPKDQPYQFAIPVMVSLNPENAGFIIRDNNETVWVLPVSSRGALSLNLILTPFRLPPGAYVYIYDADRQVVRGAYTSESSAEGFTLPLLPVPGDRMVLECHVPGKTMPQGIIGVSQVGYDFAGFFWLADRKDIYYGRSDVCEIDLSCSTNDLYLKASRSVVRLLVAGTELCTGVLVNNTGSEYKAYVLTAYHCIDTPSAASNTIFVFNYVSPWCDGPDITNLHSISGSLLRASNPDIDFTLVELSKFPSLVYRPYFSGWDITATPPANTFTLHHPEGDVMKISIDDNPPIAASYPVSGYISNGFWRVLKWEMGTTEPGSSGGPLFDQNGRLRGTLTGGAATCTSPDNDYFARLSTMYNITTITSTHLKPWLDPLSTDATVASGRDPYAYNLSRSDTLKNIPDNDPGTADTYGSPDWGYSTGFNSDGLIRYAEYIPFVGTGEIAWVRLGVAASSYLAEADSIRVFIWSGGIQPGTVIASRMFKIRETKNNYTLEVDFGRTVAVSGSFYAGYTVYYKTNPSSPQPQFAVKHSVPYLLSSQNTAWFHDGTSWKPFTQHPSFPMSTSLAIDVIMVENSILNSISHPKGSISSVTVFPNPFDGSISFSMPDSGAFSTSLHIVDNSGRIVFAGEYRNIFPGILTVELPGLVPGIYHYRMQNDSEIFSGSIIKTDAR
jgi:lysyl endopeptidase